MNKNWYVVGLTFGILCYLSLYVFIVYAMYIDISSGRLPTSSIILLFCIAIWRRAVRVENYLNRIAISNLLIRKNSAKEDEDVEKIMRRIKNFGGYN